jgi:hypothetical protein
MRKLIVLAALMAVPLLASSQASAQTYPWCANSGDNVSCLSSTYQQCRATIRGNGGTCDRNPRYEGPHAQAQERSRMSPR